MVENKINIAREIRKEAYGQFFYDHNQPYEDIEVEDEPDSDIPHTDEKVEPASEEPLKERELEEMLLRCGPLLFHILHDDDTSNEEGKQKEMQSRLEMSISKKKSLVKETV